MDPVTAQLSTSAVVVAVMEWLKDSKLTPWMTHNSSTINRVVGMFFALVSGVGLGWMYDPAAGVLTITGLQWSHVFHAVWEAFTSYGMQWMIYKGVIRKGDPGQQAAVVVPAVEGVTVEEGKVMEVAAVPPVSSTAAPNTQMQTGQHVRVILPKE